MPIYEYRCTSCGYQNDYLQKVADPQLTECPECGKSTFKKQVTAAGFQLKGTGWYATDFKNNGKGSDSSGKSGGPSAKSTSDDKAAATSSSSSDSTAAKPEASSKSDTASSTGS